MKQTRNRFRKIKKEEVLNLRKVGLKNTEIADQLGVSRQAISNALAEFRIDKDKLKEFEADFIPTLREAQRKILNEAYGNPDKIKLASFRDLHICLGIVSDTILKTQASLNLNQNNVSLIFNVVKNQSVNLLTPQQTGLQDPQKSGAPIVVIDQNKCV